MFAAMLCAAVGGFNYADAPEKEPFKYQGLIMHKSVDKLPKPTEVTMNGSKFAIGVIKDAKEYEAFAAAAGLPKADVKWGDEGIAYVILKEHTNRLRFGSIGYTRNFGCEVKFEWDGIEPFYKDRYPAMLCTVNMRSLEWISFEQGGKEFTRIKLK
jgi:hypothetical protein